MKPSEPDDESARLRDEVAEWRRRAEIAEAVAAERLARAETAESALDAARAALRAVGGPAPGSTGASSKGRPSNAAAGGAPEPVAGDDAEPAPGPPLSLRERWRRYIETVN